MLLRECIEEYLTSLRARNCSPNTLRAYANDLATFAAFLGEECSIEAADRFKIRDFLGVLYSKGMKRSSVVRKQYALRTLFEWAVAEGLLPENLVASTSVPRVPQLLPKVPTEHEVALMFQAAGQSLLPERTRVILELLYGCGLRVSELVALKVEDCSLANYTLLINGKGKKQRYVPFGDLAHEALMAYLPLRERIQRGAKKKDPARLIVGRKGPLTVREISRIVKAAGKAAGLANIHPHSLRHAFATHILENDGNLTAIKSLLGHERLTTTQKYTQVSMARVLRVYHRAHPHERYRAG